MSRLLECDGCDARYDVSQRSPGKRVRCPKCRKVLVVPERGPASERLHASSSRLRRARGVSCKQHTTRRAEGTCALCKAPMCASCRAPAPVDHACGSCATAQGLEGALKVDFGFLTTWGLALESFVSGFPRIVAWGILAFLVGFTICAIPGIIGVFLIAGAGASSTLGLLGICLVIGVLVVYWVLNEFLLVPAGCALFVDESLRRQTSPMGDALRRAWRRVLRSAGALFLIFVVYALLALLLLLPALVVFWVTAQMGGGVSIENGRMVGAQGPIILASLVLGGGFWMMASTLGLAVPVTILEQRSAFESLGRSWELSRQRLGTMLALVFSFAALYIAGSALFTLLGSYTHPGVGVVLSRVLDLFWPALLVAAYHGLSAERAGVLGRG